MGVALLILGVLLLGGWVFVWYMSALYHIHTIGDTFWIRMVLFWSGLLVLMLGMILISG